MNHADGTLLDGAEDGTAFPVEHLDAHGVAELHERRFRLALGDRLQAAHLGQAAGAVLAADIAAIPLDKAVPPF